MISRYGNFRVGSQGRSSIVPECCVEGCADSVESPGLRFCTLHRQEHGRRLCDQIDAHRHTANTTHELRYRAGTLGLEHIGILTNHEPRWYCTCGHWYINRDLQGHPFEETAKRKHRKHVKEFVLG